MSHSSLSAPEGELLLFLDRSASDSASERAISENLGRESLAVAESLASRSYIDRLYGGGYRLQAKGRQAAMEYRLSQKLMNEEHARKERDENVRKQRENAEAEARIAQLDLKDQLAEARSQEFELMLHKSTIRHSWIQWTIGAAGSCIGFIIGALVEYRTDLIGRFLSLFH